MKSLRPSQLRALLAKTIPAKEPVLITGAPGVGKSDIVLQACADAGADLIISHPVVSDPTDYKGLPWVTDGSATFLPIGDLQQLISATKPTVYFIDDGGQASPAVQAAFMQLILARRVNGHRVPDCVTFIMATNRRTDRAGVSGVLEPVKSRFATIVELAPNLDDWCAWAASAGIAPEVIAFLRFRPQFLSAFKPTADMTNSPSPRTWSAVSRLHLLGLPTDVQLASFEGAVGEEAAVEFYAFLRIWQQMVSPDVIFATPDTAPIPTEPSAMYALMTALGMRVNATTMTRYCRYLDRVCKAAQSEFAAVSLQTALARDPKLANTPGYIQAASGQLGQVLTGGGAS